MIRDKNFLFIEIEPVYIFHFTFHVFEHLHYTHFTSDYIGLITEIFDAGVTNFDREMIRIN